jgi:uncharacterized membrane protein YphA (DoxX/SURF4 family)
MNALALITVPARRIDVGRRIAIGFRLLGWTAVTVLAVLGLFVVAFAAFGNLTMFGFFFQLANLAAHYCSADSQRQASFQQTLAIVFGLALLATTFFRRGSLVQAFRVAREDEV